MKRITVAGLRKLAQMKGLILRQSVTMQEFDAYGGSVEISIGYTAPTLEIALTALHAALSTLPDKPKDKKRGEK